MAIEGQIILQNARVQFGQLETAAKNGDVVYSSTFVDPESGLAVSVLWNAHTAREFFEKALEAMSGVAPIPKPKLVVPGVREIADVSKGKIL